jgi:hypothetical protein
MNITLFCPDPTDATSWYRGVGPFAELSKSNPDVRISFYKEANWATLAFTDIAFMQRPHREQDLEIIKRCKEQQIPVWVDFDDYLFDVPKWNQTYKHYSSEKTRKVVAESIAQADVVTVSTDFLGEKLAPLNKNIVTIPNALNTRLFKFSPIEQNNIILWRGSATHKGDYSEIAQQLVELSLKPHMRSWAFIFVGDRPWFAELMPEKQVMAVEAMDVIDYHRFIRDIKPAIMVVPLADNDFNRCKSNCAWLEGTYAGAAVVGPENFPEFEKPGITPTTPPFITETLERLIDNPFLRKTKVGNAQFYIDNFLTLKHTNDQRMAVINQLIGGAKA